MKKNGHVIVPSSSIVPQNDPTTLFTGSGMQPMVPYLLGEPHPEGTRIADSQKCFRAEDIEEIGDNRHTTFFEMLGNWSFGDYFKAEQLPFIYEFLTKELGFEMDRLYATVFIGDPDNNLPKDTESIEILKKIFADAGIDANIVDIGSEENGYEKGMQDGRIFAYDAKKNWWSRAGVPDNMPVGEPGGPDSEIFYDFGTPHDPAWGEHCHPNCDCGRFVEIGNSVFMEYIKQPDGSFDFLPNKNVDFGGGLARMAAATQNDSDVFKVRPLYDIVETLEELSGSEYQSNEKTTMAFRVIADHMHGAIFMMADGVVPKNTEQGYALRRLLRRSVRFADTIGVPSGKLQDLVAIVAKAYADSYPEISENKKRIAELISAEEDRFRLTLQKGLREFEKGERDAFILFTTYGFPLEMTMELAEEQGETIDIEDFKQKMAEHQATSKAGAEQKFAGGLADHSDQVVKLHTAHHLLLAALQKHVDADIHQRGSNITGERLRIDFSFERKLTDEEKQAVEDQVNEWIKQDLAVVRREMPREEAMQIGAEMEFGAKYPDTVSVYFIEVSEGNAISKEFCGGPHVERIGGLGTFKIKKEKASSAGIRRIKAILS